MNLLIFIIVNIIKVNIIKVNVSIYLLTVIIVFLYFIPFRCLCVSSYTESLNYKLISPFYFVIHLSGLPFSRIDLPLITRVSSKTAYR